MGAIKGLDILLQVESTDGEYVDLGGQRGATLNRSAETIDVTNKVSGGWKQSITGFKEWSLDCDGIYIEDDAAYTLLEEAFEAGTELTVKLSKGEDFSFSGKAVITDFPLEAPYDDAATYSVSLAGTGALAQA